MTIVALGGSPGLAQEFLPAPGTSRSVEVAYCDLQLKLFGVDRELFLLHNPQCELDVRPTVICGAFAEPVVRPGTAIVVCETLGSSDERDDDDNSVMIEKLPASQQEGPAGLVMTAPKAIQLTPTPGEDTEPPDAVSSPSAMPAIDASAAELPDEPLLNNVEAPVESEQPLDASAQEAVASDPASMDAAEQPSAEGALDSGNLEDSDRLAPATNEPGIGPSDAPSHSNSEEGSGGGAEVSAVGAL